MTDDGAAGLIATDGGARRRVEAIMGYGYGGVCREGMVFVCG